MGGRGGQEIQASALQKLMGEPWNAGAHHASYLPAELLGHFTDTAAAKGEDAVALQVACACHLPQVAAAVGAERWPVLQPALQALTEAPEPAARAALASNLHRLAEVLPKEMVGQVLLSSTEVSSFPTGPPTAFLTVA